MSELIKSELIAEVLKNHISDYKDAKWEIFEMIRNENQFFQKSFDEGNLTEQQVNILIERILAYIQIITFNHTWSYGYTLEELEINIQKANKLAELITELRKSSNLDHDYILARRFIRNANSLMIDVGIKSQTLREKFIAGELIQITKGSSVELSFFDCDIMYVRIGQFNGNKGLLTLNRINEAVTLYAVNKKIKSIAENSFYLVKDLANLYQDANFEGYHLSIAIENGGAVIIGNPSNRFDLYCQK